MRTVELAVASLASILALELCGCAPPSNPSKSGNSFGSQASEASAEQCTISGTTVDAATGEALGGVAITAPGGARATSDAHGRFTIEGLSSGTSGEIEAVAKDGRRARSPLRPLSPGTLEIVLHLK